MRRNSHIASAEAAVSGGASSQVMARRVRSAAWPVSTVGGLPVASLALILGIDRFRSEARALTHLVGNGAATLVVVDARH